MHLLLKHTTYVVFTINFQHPKMRDESERKVIQIDAEGKQVIVFKCEHCEKPHFTPAALSCKLILIRKKNYILLIGKFRKI